MSTKQISFREHLIQHIKDVGQDLIDQAEMYIPEGLDGVSAFEIDISFPIPTTAGIPEITLNKTILSKNSYQRYITPVERDPLCPDCIYDASCAIKPKTKCDCFEGKKRQ